MQLKLKIMSGPLQGRSYSLYDGLIIGRSSSDITLPDPKISGRHAKIEFSIDGEPELIDLGSNNGIRIGDQKLTKLTLSKGTRFRLGQTEFEVFTDKMDSAPPVSPTPNLLHKPSHNSDDAMPHWTTYFSKLIDKYATKSNTEVREVFPFKPILILTITHGIQAGTEWFLGYGPRAIGSCSLDFVLHEDGIPKIAFSVSPQGTSAIFATDFSDKVLLNGRSISAEKLLPGDEIRILNTRIKVSFQ